MSASCSSFADYDFEHPRFFSEKLANMYEEINVTNSSILFRGHERLNVEIFPEGSHIARKVAHEIADTIRECEREQRVCVLGLATGSTPIPVYHELVRLHQEEGLSFRNVISFNLDEYSGLDPSNPQSYSFYMHSYLFDHVDILPENCHVPSGQVSEDNAVEYCLEYEQMIEKCGGIDFQILGIGRTGHIGFNEPGSHAGTRTRMVYLDPMTRRDAASSFFGEENVPTRAITMGVATILSARKVRLMAVGEGKERIIQEAVEGPCIPDCPASLLQSHPNVAFYVDRAAGNRLARLRKPWSLSPIDMDWNDDFETKAVVRLSREVQKPILRLNLHDYRSARLQSLIDARGPVADLNSRVCSRLANLINDSFLGSSKRILFTSPHPDDSEICAAGTMRKLIAQNRDVHIMYFTCGSLAVTDEYALQILDTSTSVLRAAERIMNCSDGNVCSTTSEQIQQTCSSTMQSKKIGESDPLLLERIKASIRESEARAAVRSVGIMDPSHVHFLDLPFYRTGSPIKKPITDEEDVLPVLALLRRLRPEAIFVAADLTDPHGTHRLCLCSIMRAFEMLRSSGDPADSWWKDSVIWLYRGAWQEWDLETADAIVPLDPDEVKLKRLSIFRHMSQKDPPPFPGGDPREFWQRVEARNRHTAEIMATLGLPAVEAVEVFVRMNPMPL